MARYLSQGWFDEVNEAARANPALEEATAGTRLTLQQIVTGAPDGELHYWVRIDDGSVEAVLGDAPGARLNPDATVIESYETAAAVSRGELSTENAFLEGRIRIQGDIAVLLRHQSVLKSLGEAFADVRGRTEYR